LSSSPRVAGVGEQQRRQAAAEDLPAQVADGEGVAALAFQQDGDGGEEAEDVEQLLVGGVIREEVPEVDVPEGGGGAGEGGPAAAGDGDVLGRVLGGHAAAVEAVVEVGDGLAELPDAGDGGVLVVVRVNGDGLDAGRAAGERAGLGHALAEVAPALRLPGEAEAVGLGGDEDHARLRDGAEAAGLLRRRGGG
jgi:hypothetical protein